MSHAHKIESEERFSIPLVLHFDGAIPAAGLDADEVAAVAEGMAKAIHFLVERADDRGCPFNLHLTEVRSGSATFNFLFEGAAILQSILPGALPGGFTIREVGQVFADAIKMLEFLRGKPPKEVVRIAGDNNVVVANSEGATTIVNPTIINVAGNVYFQEQAAKSTKPLRKARRTLRVSQDHKEVLATASESYPSIAARVANDNTPLTVNTIEATLRVAQPHLDGEDSWRFKWGPNRITAKVTDNAFMQKVRAREETFATGDLLRVKLRIEEQQKGKKVTKQHFIDEVIRKEPG